MVLAVENAKQARTRGVDLDARWSVTRELSLALSVAYDDARYTDFKNASCYGGQTKAQGCVNSTQNLDGGRLPNTPKTMTYFTARYERLLGERLLGYGQANYSYRSTVTFSSSGDPMMVQAGYGLLNLNFGLETANGRWNLNFYGKNILDKRYVDAISYVSNNIYYTNDIGYEDLRNFGVAPWVFVCDPVYILLDADGLESRHVSVAPVERPGDLAVTARQQGAQELRGVGDHREGSARGRRTCRIFARAQAIRAAGSFVTCNPCLCSIAPGGGSSERTSKTEVPWSRAVGSFRPFGVRTSNCLGTVQSPA